jgi:hypothetical protein
MPTCRVAQSVNVAPLCNNSIMARVVGRQANNQDVFVWSLFQLGGRERAVDVEEIFLKCFELAPARLGWRTRPEIPDYKKISKALQSVEAKTHVGLIEKIDQYHRRLTVMGIKWIEANRGVLESRYGGAPVIASTKSPHERLRRRIRESRVFSSPSPSIIEIAEILECSPASVFSVWQSRLTQVEVAGQALSDNDLTSFSNRIREVLKENGIAI